MRAGALLSDADKAELRKLNAEESSLTTAFGAKLLAATNAGAVLVTDKARLEGLDEGTLAAAVEAAKAAGKEGWLLELQNTTQQPVLGKLKDRALREEILAASMNRAARGDDNDTRATILRLAKLRARKAQLLGFDNYAAYAIADQMAGTPEAALKLLNDTVPAATARARAELAKIQSVVERQGGGFSAGAADWDFYAEQVRQAEYDLDEAQVRPYFELDRVLRDGVFYAAQELYGITLKERTDLPVYHPDVRVFDVFDADGTQLAVFYLDPFKRPSKRGGAWMGNFVEQDGLAGTIPVIYNVENFTKPAPGQPALLSFDDVTTLFHEFGHALHGLFSRTTYPSLSGTNVPRDFVEFPSQFNEHWALYPQVFANYARHYQTSRAGCRAAAGAAEEAAGGQGAGGTRVRAPDRFAGLPGPGRVRDGTAPGTTAARGRPGRAGKPADPGGQSAPRPAATDRGHRGRHPGRRPGDPAAGAGAADRRRAAGRSGRLRAADQPPAGGLSAWPCR